VFPASNSQLDAAPSRPKKKKKKKKPLMTPYQHSLHYVIRLCKSLAHSVSRLTLPYQSRRKQSFGTLDRLWRPGNPCWNIAVRFPGSLDSRHSLLQALMLLTEIVRRHDVLRTRLRPARLAHIRPNVHSKRDSLPLYDLSGTLPSDRDAEERKTGPCGSVLAFDLQNWFPFCEFVY